MECFVACFDLKRLFCYRQLNGLEERLKSRNHLTCLRVGRWWWDSMPMTATIVLAQRRWGEKGKLVIDRNRQQAFPIAFSISLFEQLLSRACYFFSTFRVVLNNSAYPH